MQSPKSRPSRRSVSATILSVLAVPGLLLLGGCADMERRYRDGLKWHEENEAMKRDLERQGFPQYSPPL